MSAGAIEREPLVVEQVATALGLPVSSLARERQREALGLVRCEPPDWCTDLRTTFFTAASVEAAAGRQHEYRERLRAARHGILPASWAGFAPVQREQQNNK